MMSAAATLQRTAAAERTEAMAERRRDERRAAELVVLFWRLQEPAAASAVSHDVSAGGMFVATPHPPPRGTALRLEACLATSDEPPVRARAVVRWRRRWRQPRGMGVELIDLPEADRERLRRWSGVADGP